MPDEISLLAPLTNTGTGGGEKLQIRRVYLEVSEGADAGVDYTATSGRVVIGTGDGCDLRLTDGTVSRYHCELVVQANGTVRAMDLGSRNGTLVDGVWVERCLLHEGAVIALGNARLRFSGEHGWLTLEVSAAAKFGPLRGISLVMRRVFFSLDIASQNLRPVLLEGEIGTGKEAAAMAIHANSAVKTGPVRVIDCGRLSDEVNATANGTGLASAPGGTLVLANVELLSLEQQKMVSHLIEAAQTRVIATTTRPLGQEVNAGRMRGSFYRQLSQQTLVMPPVRDRIEDLPLLLDEVVTSLQMDPAVFAQSSRHGKLLEKLQRHRWPGNLPELRAYIRTAIA
ncbi:MAG: sigma 54-interacting transcriptional regulator [Myxococcales bacterium]|nr:sigma 54-interacting transcriptional regulator [Myxococcales bacterium]